MYIKYWFSFISILFFSLYTSGQQDLLTLDEAVEMSYKKNAEIQQLKARLEQQKNVWRTETGIAAPEISYFKEGIGKGPGDIFDEKRITVSQEIDFPLTTHYRLQSLKETLKALDFQLQSREREIRAEVKSRYVEVMYALRLQKSRQNQLQLTQDLYNAVFTKFETGMANGIDLVNAELRMDEAKNDLDQSEWILHQARYGLFYVMGLPAEDQKYTIGFSDTLFAAEIEISQIFALAVQEEQPDYQSTIHELKASELIIKEAKSNILPDLRMNLYRQNYGSGFDFNGFEVGFRFPIWTPLEQKGNISIAKARQSEILWKQQEIRLNMKKEIEYAWHNYAVSRDIVNRYNETMHNRALRLQDLTLKAYQLGEIDLLNLLNAQQIFLASEQRYLAAMRDYYLQLIALEKFLAEELVY